MKKTCVRVEKKYLKLLPLQFRKSHGHVVKELHYENIATVVDTLPRTVMLLSAIWSGGETDQGVEHSKA